MDAYPAAVREDLLRRGGFTASVIFEKLYGHIFGYGVFAVTGAVYHVEGIGQKKEKQHQGREAEETEGLPVFRLFGSHFSLGSIVGSPFNHSFKNFDFSFLIYILA